jgi:hypothetical protein
MRLIDGTGAMLDSRMAPTYFSQHHAEPSRRVCELRGGEKGKSSFLVKNLAEIQVIPQKLVSGDTEIAGLALI